MWNEFVGALGALLTELAQWLDGSFGCAVIALALMVRLALLPLTLGNAEKSWLQQQRMRQLKPQFDRIRQRHAKDRVAQAQAVQDLYREHRISPVHGSSVLTAMVQLPIGAGLYAAIRHCVAAAGSFLWIRNLARPDLLVALGVAALSFAAIVLNPAMPQQARLLLTLLPVLVSFLMVWHLAAGLGLYWAGSSSVQLLQALLLRRRLARAAA